MYKFEAETFFWTWNKTQKQSCPKYVEQIKISPKKMKTWSQDGDVAYLQQCFIKQQLYLKWGK